MVGGLLLVKTRKGIFVTEVGSKGDPGSDGAGGVAVLFARTFHHAECLRQRLIAGFAAVRAVCHEAGHASPPAPVAFRSGTGYWLPFDWFVLHDGLGLDGNTPDLVCGTAIRR